MANVFSWVRAHWMPSLLGLVACLVLGLMIRGCAIAKSPAAVPGQTDAVEEEEGTNKPAKKDAKDGKKDEEKGDKKGSKVKWAINPETDRPYVVGSKDDPVRTWSTLEELEAYTKGEEKGKGKKPKPESKSKSGTGDKGNGPSGGKTLADTAPAPAATPTTAAPIDRTVVPGNPDIHLVRRPGVDDHETVVMSDGRMVRTAGGTLSPILVQLPPPPPPPIPRDPNAGWAIAGVAVTLAVVVVLGVGLLILL